MVEKTRSTNPDFEFDYRLTDEELAAGYTQLLMTGPIAGTIVMKDGTAYDVTEYAIAVKAAHAETADGPGELQLAILKAHHAAGRFLDSPLPAE